MLVKELIERLKRLPRQDDDVRVCIYGCGGPDDSYPIFDLEQDSFKFSNGEVLNYTQININVSCQIHSKKWNCESYPRKFKRKIANILVKIAERIVE